jgi:hypothetical protein
MGRHKIDVNRKKVRLSVGVENDILIQLDRLAIKRSKVINWLLSEYFTKNKIL